MKSKEKNKKFLMVDRIADKGFVYVVDDFQNEFVIPSHFFDVPPEEGQVFSVLISYSKKETEQRKSKVLNLIEDLTQSNNSKDFTL